MLINGMFDYPNPCRAPGFSRSEESPTQRTPVISSHGANEGYSAIKQTEIFPSISAKGRVLRLYPELRLFTSILCSHNIFSLLSDGEQLVYCSFWLLIGNLIVVMHYFFRDKLKAFQSYQYKVKDENT